MLIFIKDTYARDAQIITDKSSFSLCELLCRATHTYEKLQKLGMSPNRIVAFKGYPSIQNIVLILALLQLKALICPLNHHLSKQQLEPHLSALDNPLYLDEKTIKKITGVSDATPLHPCWNVEKASFLLFTSGSTSTPKIVALSLSNFYYSAIATNDAFNVTEKDGWLFSLPLFHVGGLCLFFRCLLSHSKMVFSQQKLEQIVLHPSITRMSLVPTQLYRLLKLKNSLVDKALSAKKTLLIGGAAIPKALWKEIQEKGLAVCTTWGMTEMCSQITLNTKPSKEYNSGKTLPFREVKIDSDNELLVRGKTLFLGYYNKEDGITLPPLREEYFPSKDIGYFDNEGFLHITGRKDLMFICGGENIHPEEIERALKNIEGIEDAYVIAMDDKEWGKRPFAFVKMNKGYPLNSLSIQADLEKVLPKIKIPKDVLELPEENHALKINRSKLIDLAKSSLR